MYIVSAIKNDKRYIYKCIYEKNNITHDDDDDDDDDDDVTLYLYH